MANKKDDNIIYVNGCPLWMLTLGDCISLLVTFFVMLISFSKPNTDQLMDAIHGMKGALSVFNLGDTPSPNQTSKKTGSNTNIEVDTFTDGGQTESSVSEDKLAVVNLNSVNIANRFNEFKERILELGFHNFVMAKQIERGIQVEIPFTALFKDNTSELKPDAFKLIQPVANLASSVGNEIIMIAAFNISQNAAVDTSEWSLPQTRVLEISRALNERYHISPYRFTFGYDIIEPTQNPNIRIIIAEKLGISNVTIKEILNFSQEL